MNEEDSIQDIDIHMDTPLLLGRKNRRILLLSLYGKIKTATPAEHGEPGPTNLGHPLLGATPSQVS
jgi:hypothetical protein